MSAALLLFDLPTNLNKALVARRSQPRGSSLLCRRKAFAEADAALVSSASPELSALSSCTILQVPSGDAVCAGSLVPQSGNALLFVTTHTADFDSFEQASKLVDLLPQCDEAGLSVSLVVIGTPAAAQLFAELTRFPAGRLFSDERAAVHAALRFEPGAGRPGGPAPFLSSLPGLGKLMAMCAGIGSPGTLTEVFRGYLGDRNAPPVFRSGSNVDLEWRDAFNLVGTGFQRPFELATLRGMNMASILGRWKELAPADEDLLVQRGGALLFKDGRVTWSHRDRGILGFVDPKVAVAAAGIVLTAAA